MVAGLLAPLSNLLKNELNLPVPDYLVGFVAFAIVIFTCFMIGLFIRTRIGKDLFGYVERTYLLRLPMYGTIKETVQQFTGAKKMPFSDVVLVDVFGNGTRMTVPADEGFRPRSEPMMAFSMTCTMSFSHGVTVNVRESSTPTLDTWFSGTSLP